MSSAEKKKGTSSQANERATTLQSTYVSDPKYKKYIQQVEKCLNAFDNVQEWADCIAFLKQLLKTLQSYMQFKEIPKKLIVAKRLAQCLNPALPTGVHQRALDVYSHILAVRGSEGLKQDLALWSSGLFPFFEYAATSVKPTLLNIYDTHYLPLQGDLRPIMKSFILALLPGLEEESGEYFEKVLSLLDKISGTVSPSFFFQNIWLVILTTPPARGTALNFLARRLPRLNPDEDITPIVGRDLGLMIRAFSAALEDDNLLVRRSALDILLQTVRLDGYAVHRAHAADRAILMRAATGVVLRRDLSLNRRLYTWLLGPEERSEEQVTYFRKWGMELLRSTLKTEMLEPSGEYAETRPFKIFISLLDKWEIGAPLTEALVYDAYKAVKRLIERPTDANEDISMTASTLYEAVEPQIMWKHMLTAIFKELTSDGETLEAIELVRFILRSFSQDEEIQTIHLPVIFASIVDILDLQADRKKLVSPTYQRVMLLLKEMFSHIPQVALLKWPEVTKANEEARQFQRPYNFACALYGISTVIESSITSRFAMPFASVLENVISCLRKYAVLLREMGVDARDVQKAVAAGDIVSAREMVVQMLGLMNMMVERLASPIELSWDPAAWFDVLLETMKYELVIFNAVDHIVTLGITLHKSTFINPKLSIDDRMMMSKMVNKLLSYLRPEYSMYHVRAVALIWALDTVTEKAAFVESIVAQHITEPRALQNVNEAYEAYGILWRLTEDNLLPGFRLKVPMMLVLEILKSDDPTLRRIGETWMRCNLRSYLRILDPILYDLMDPTILRTPGQMKVHGKEIQGFIYERPFDQRLINYLLEALLSIVRFGGQGFVKTARTSFIKRSHHSGLVTRAAVGNLPAQDATYLEVLVEILLRFLQSEPNGLLSPTMLPFNNIFHSSTVELLQLIVSRGEIGLTTIETLEAVVIGKLYFCIHKKRLDLQNKLLHLLHALISVSISGTESAMTPGNAKEDDNSLAVAIDQEKLGDRNQRTYAVNPLLVQTLIDGISIRSNRPILQHWLDFILLAVPQFQPALHSVVMPLNDCLCKQLHLSLKEIEYAAQQPDSLSKDVYLSITDADMIMLLNGLERFVLLSLAHMDNDSEDEESLMEKPMHEGGGGGLLGYVSNVFGSDSTQTAIPDQLMARSPAYRALDEGIRVLYTIWSILIWPKAEPESARDESLSMIYNRTRVRCRRALEHLFRVRSSEVFESIVECWNHDKLLHSASSHEAIFELIDILVSNALNAVHMTCESIWYRISGVPEKSRKQAINPNLSEGVLFEFLEQYLSRLEGPIVVQVWGRYLQLAKDVASSTKDLKAQSFPTLKCLCILAERITRANATEDRRIRKELQDAFGKLLDGCVAAVGRSQDQGSWIRRSAKESLATNGRESPVPRETKDEKLNASTVSLPDANKQSNSSDYSSYEIVRFISASALPNLRKFLLDNDKVAGACTNIVYYIVSPAMRGRTRPMDVDNVIISIIQEMTRIPAALKAWKTPVTELFNDNRLFNATPDVAEPWKVIIRTLFDADKTALPELLSKVTTAPSANIFTNREYEMLVRSLNVRRLSFVVYSGGKNHFLVHLPTIQEKLVDILRNVTASIVQSEVFLCVRVLLCRLSKHNLTSFWPVLLTELYRIFEQIMTNIPPDGSEDLQLVLAACKCLDLLVTLQTEEFQIYQWIFITDTVDAIYRPNNWTPEAMMDKLAEITGNLPIADSRKVVPSQSENSLVSDDQRTSRRPLLNGFRQIESIRELIPFFSNISISSYESMYASSGNIDWEAVEKGIMEDLFDGR